MSKNFIKNNNLYILNKKKIIFLATVFALSILLISFFLVNKSNEFLIDNSINVHKKNILLNNKLQELKNIIIDKDFLTDNLKNKNKELSSLFNKYTDTVKFKVATSEELRKDVFSKDEEILELNRKINYYKFLLNSKNTNNLITIEDFSLKNHKDSDFLTYSFLLLSNKDGKKLKGSFQLFYDGVNNNTGNKILKQSLMVSNNKISFTNFLKISGKLKFPKNHSYNTIYLSVKCNGKMYKYKHTNN